MSIASEIARLQQAKEDIATAIGNKGVTVSVSATLDDFADYVDSINVSGGGSGETVRIADSFAVIATVAWMDANGNPQNSMLMDENYIPYFEPLIGSIVSCMTLSAFTHEHLQELTKTSVRPGYYYGWLVV